LDPKVYSFQNLQFLSQNTSFVPQHKLELSLVLNELRRSLMSYPAIAALTLSALVLLNRSRIVQIFGVLALAWCGAFFIAVSVVARIPPFRVWIVMLLALYVISLALWCQAGGLRQPAKTN